MCADANGQETPELVTCDGCGAEVEETRFQVGPDDLCDECGTECDECGCDARADEVEYVNGQGLCHDCLVTCVECDRGMHPSDWMTNTTAGDVICERCYTNHYFTCDDCGDVTHSDNACGRNDWTYCPSCDPGEDEDEDEGADGPIRGYHSSRREVFPLPSPATRANGGRFFGVELEVERREGGRARGEIAGQLASWVNNQSADITAERHRVPLLHFEEDGSLRDGFEMVTPPMGLDDHARLWKTALSPTLTRDLRSHDTDTCGLHVHVSRKGMTDLHVSKVVCFVNDPDNADLIRAVARRYSTGYCEVSRKRLATGHKDNGNRYQAVNLCNSHTIEFRIFKGSLKYVAVMAAIEFAAAVVEFCQPTGADGFNLKTAAFLDFINTAAMRKTTRHLRTYLAERMTGHTFPAGFVPAMMK